MSAELVTATSEAQGRARGGLGRLSPWALLLAASLVVVMAAATALGVLWVSSAKTTIASSRLPAALMGVELHVQSGDVTILGGRRRGIAISRSDHAVFGHGPRENRSFRRGILRLSSSCPALVLGSCASSYRIEVPDNIPISIRAERGSVRLEDYRGSADIATNSGGISVAGYCGFVLGAASASGDISVSTACSPDRLTLRSDTGDVSATVPTGNYRIQTFSNAGAATVRGLVSDNGAPWEIQALSNNGNVIVRGDS